MRPRMNRNMRHSSLCTFILKPLLIGAFLVALPTLSQTSSDPAAPTISADPTDVDQAWQKASSKYDAQRAEILKEVDQVNHDGPYRADWQSLQTYQVAEWH